MRGKHPVTSCRQNARETAEVAVCMMNLGQCLGLMGGESRLPVRVEMAQSLDCAGFSLEMEATAVPVASPAGADIPRPRITGSRQGEDPGGVQPGAEVRAALVSAGAAVPALQAMTVARAEMGAGYEGSIVQADAVPEERVNGPDLILLQELDAPEGLSLPVEEVPFEPSVLLRQGVVTTVEAPVEKAETKGDEADLVADAPALPPVPAVAPAPAAAPPATPKVEKVDPPPEPVDHQRMPRPKPDDQGHKGFVSTDPIMEMEVGPLPSSPPISAIPATAPPAASAALGAVTEFEKTRSMPAFTAEAAAMPASPVPERAVLPAPEAEAVQATAAAPSAEGPAAVSTRREPAATQPYSPGRTLGLQEIADAGAEPAVMHRAPTLAAWNAPPPVAAAGVAAVVPAHDVPGQAGEAPPTLDVAPGEQRREPESLRPVTERLRPGPEPVRAEAQQNSRMPELPVAIAQADASGAQDVPLPVSDSIEHSAPGHSPLMGETRTTAPVSVDMRSVASQMSEPRPVAAQIVAAIATRHDSGTIELALSPEELGRVRMVIHHDSQVMSVVIHADRPETLDLMRRHAEVLAQEFRAQGYSGTAFSFSGGGGNAPDPRGQGAGSGTWQSPGNASLAPPEHGAFADRPRPAAEGLDLRL